MGYYIRVFCKSDTKPNVRNIIDYINSLEYNFKAETNLTIDKLNSNNWIDFELKYKSDRLPILVEYNNIKDSDGLAKAEIEEFIDEIGKPGFFESNKKKVIRQLRDTKYIITNQLPSSDIDDDGYNANGEFIKYLADKYDGMIHADGEGFYEGTKIILKTE